MNEQGKASDSQRKHELEIGALKLRGVGQQVGNGQLGVRVLRCGDGKGVMDIRVPMPNTTTRPGLLACLCRDFPVSSRKVPKGQTGRAKRYALTEDGFRRVFRTEFSQEPPRV
ncbi:Hypp7616 [Branchiostoma lanceolatum]|uniref:Hypp7616 protein n=1 Tax=Branchiostoma lanceolatum TaxID=7740 RepID=A0A8J9Z2I8_BRALA|nr:Hypp7616 [Branchiostoma lanceolatum]